MNLQKTNETHCSVAVPHKNKLVNNPYPNSTRVINASTGVNGSTNWRLDYYKFKGYSYAQVLKNSTCNGHNVNSSATKNPTPALPRKEVHPKMQVKNKLRVTHKPLVVKAKKSGPQAKVGPAEYKIPCFNRFSPLDHQHTVIEPSSNVDTLRLDNHYHNGVTGPGKKKMKNRLTSQQQDSLSETITCLPTSSTHQDKNSSTNNNESNCMVVGSTDTKYDLPLRIKNKVSTYRQVLPSCPTLQAWDSQNKFKFGFIPLGSLKVPDRWQPKDSNLDPLVLHKKVKDSGDYNFMKSQITVKSQLNPDVWDSLLTDYWDKQLCSLIRFGFPLDFQWDNPFKSHLDNHTLGKLYPKDVEAYLSEEIAYGAILGPFKEPPLSKLHVSPFMTREKPNAPHRRVIIDLSFPQGLSVNAGICRDSYLDTLFLLKLPTIDTITNQIKVLGKGCMLYKIDISRAFRHVKLDPRELIS